MVTYDAKIKVPIGSQ